MRLAKLRFRRGPPSYPPPPEVTAPAPETTPREVTMISKLHSAGAAFAVAAAVLFATPLWAATIINVVEEGEGGSAMTLKLDPQTVKAGEVTFNLKNDAVSEEHEMVVVRLKTPDQKIPFDAKKNRVDEDKLKSMGEIGDIKPGATGTMTAKLKAGTYLVFCNIKGHYQAGMVSKLTVTP